MRMWATLVSLLCVLPLLILLPLRRQLHTPFHQCRPQHVLDLPVEAAQLVVCPALQGVHDLAVDAQQEGLAIRHGRLLIDRAGVDDRLRRAIAAEHHQQVAHHRRLALIVQ